MQVTEGRWDGKIQAEFATLYNFFLSKKSAQQFLLTEEILLVDRAAIKIEASVYYQAASTVGDDDDL